MAQTTRQAKLFAAEDYKVVYDSFINADLKAYDFDTIRESMVSYVRNNYPESYNDWIESAEFVSLLDVVAQFGHNLAFRLDLNTRNNFLSTSERTESVLKLAEFLGYQTKRNVPAFGQMKIISVKTNEAVIGSAGTSLGGQDIRFESTNNVNTLDDFITIMNAVMQSSNNFGSPKKQVNIENSIYQFYKLANNQDQIKFDIQGNASGISSTYNIVGIDYDEDLATIYETSPDISSSFGIAYKNDGNGISSDNTGFFVGVKQGTLSFKDFTIDQPIDNMVLDVNVDNINQTDVWVQNISSTGSVLKEWSKVENVYGQNEIYNSLPGTSRDIFSVKTRLNNQISIQFPDKNFGNLPNGVIRVWYRTSINDTYVVRPDDLGTKRISVQYTGIDGNTYTAVFGVQLKTPIRTASASESMDDIKINAPRNYSAQNRMITASDYNNMMQTTSTRVLKTKSINRTHSGHSRYISKTDPTGAYSSLDIYGKDGIMFAYNRLLSKNTNQQETGQLFNTHVKNILDNSELINLYYTKFADSFENLKESNYPRFDGYTWPSNSADCFIWQSSDSTVGTNNGYFRQDADVVRVGKTQVNYMKHIEVGALLEFAVPTKNSVGQVVSYELIWARVVNVVNNGLGQYTDAGIPTGLTDIGTGAILLDTNVPDDACLSTIYPAFNRQFNNREKQIIQTFIESKQTFALYYNFENTSWEVFKPSVTQSFNDVYPPVFATNEASWLIWFEYTQGKFNIHTRTLRFEFSSSDVEFNNITNEYEINTYTLKNEKDFINILNDNFQSAGKFNIIGYFTDDNGVAQSNKVILSLTDKNRDNRPDNPKAFTKIASETVLVDQQGNGNFETFAGKTNIRFEWNHSPAENILVNPSFTNVIDVFVLSKEYDTNYRNYLVDDKNNKKPSVPTTVELKSLFNDIADKKAMSDTVVYRPVTYKPLFGKKSQEQLQASFRVIKLKNAKVTDNEIKSKVIEKISEYFDTTNWDFGETFYFTELAAYVHQELSGLISSFVIVPESADSVFGNLFEVTPKSNEMFIPDISIEDIDIIDTITEANIRAGSK